MYVHVVCIVCDVCSVSTQLQWFEQGHIDDMVCEDEWVACLIIPYRASGMQLCAHVCVMTSQLEFLSSYLFAGISWRKCLMSVSPSLETQRPSGWCTHTHTPNIAMLSNIICQNDLDVVALFLEESL